MAEKVVTFRAGLKTPIGDLLTDADMVCPETEESLVALVTALADYREEGRSLFPRVLICDDLDKVLRNVQGSNPILIGTGSRGTDTVLRALKKCAPLADNSWAIWIDRKPDHFDYGVFREPAPTALDLRQTLIDTPPGEGLRALLVAQFGPRVVELIPAGKPGLRIHLSGSREDQVSAGDFIQRVVDWSCSDLTDENSRYSYVSFCSTVLRDILRKGHGALIAVAPHDQKLLVGASEDAVVLDPPIDVATLVKAHAEAQTSSALTELLGSASLIAGMLGSDGITVFDTAGRILAFNWFIQTDVTKLTPRDQIGGARHRAFSALKGLVDAGQLCGAFIRSSDGAEQAHGKA
jgi:hypothetical protein